MITTEVLDEKLKMLESQKEQHFAIYHQAIGAIGIVQHLKDIAGQKDHMTLDEFGHAMGGKVESIDPL